MDCMRMPSKWTIGFGVFAGLVILGGVVYWSLPPAEIPGRSAWQAREERMGQLEANLKEITRQIKSVQGTGICDTDQQCRVVGLGAPVCGFTRDYLVYSTRDADESKLREYLEQFRQTHQSILDLALAASRCGIAPHPVFCRARRCSVSKN